MGFGPYVSTLYGFVYVSLSVFLDLEIEGVIYIYGAPILGISVSYTTTQHSR